MESSQPKLQLSKESVTVIGQDYNEYENLIKSVSKHEENGSEIDDVFLNHHEKMLENDVTYLLSLCHNSFLSQRGFTSPHFSDVKGPKLNI